jgi:multiple antibiotic resistance protein
MGLGMLNSEPSPTQSKPQAGPTSLFYPLTFPLTVGPGSISVLITLSAHAHTDDLAQTFLRHGVLGISLLCVMIATYFCFVYSERVMRLIGSQGSLVLNRLMAFLVFCVGLQVALGGLSHTFPHLFQ